MNQLPELDAKLLAAMLKSIPGFSWDDANVKATAMDLVRWCHGAEIGGETFTAQEQAMWLVSEARQSWEKWRSTAGLYSMFLAKFKPAPEHRPIDADISPEQHAAWRAQYGAPEPAFAKKLLSAFDLKKQHEGFRKSLFWQSIRDPIYYTEGPGQAVYKRNKDDSAWLANEKRKDRIDWYQHMEKNKREHPAEVAAFLAELEEHGWDALMAFDWAKAEGAA